MYDFFLLSRKNLLKAILFTSVIFFVVIVALCFIVAISNNFLHELLATKTIVGLILFSIGTSLMVMAIAFYSEYCEFKKQWDIFQRIPFSQFSSIGFQKIQLFEKSFWKLYREAYRAVINDYIVIAAIQSPKVLSIMILSEKQVKVDLPVSSHYRELEISSTPVGYELKLPVDSYSTPGIGAIQEMLSDLTSTLKLHRITPAAGLGAYESKLIHDMIYKGLQSGLPKS